MFGNRMVFGRDFGPGISDEISAASHGFDCPRIRRQTEGKSSSDLLAR